MKKLSIWGKRNPVLARLIIVLCHVIVISLGITFGIFTFFEEFQIPKEFLLLLIIIFSCAYLFYPNRKVKNWLFQYSWSKRFKHDIIMALCYFSILAISVNQFAFQPLVQVISQPEVRLMSANPWVTPVIYSKKEIKKESRSKIRLGKAEIKKQIKAFKAEWKEQTDKQVPLKILLILLTLVLAAGAFAAVGSLSCQLSCGGQEGAAIIVAVGGTAAIIVLSVIAIRAIVRIGKAPKNKPDTSNPMVTHS